MATQSNHSLHSQSEGFKSVHAVPSKRNAFEQQEFQRKNPHLFTTLTQQVLIDGSLLTFDEVTRNIQKQLDRLEEIHDGNKYWWLFAPKEQVDMFHFLNGELDKCRQGFVTNYKRMYERQERVNDLVATDPEANKSSSNPQRKD